MNESTPACNPPRLTSLGRDLLRTTSKQRVLALARPFLGIAVFVVNAYFGLWWLAPLIVFAIFVSVVTVTHDVVHNALGLGRRASEPALFAYRIKHRQHHRVFPGPDDPEGDPARLTFRSAVLYGPLFLPRHWWWALRRSRDHRGEQLWLLAEATFALGYVTSWTYPVLTVPLPHRHYGDTPLTQTHTLRGRIIPPLFLELTYHLDHLYPQVPSHNLPELSRRLGPFLREAGVDPVRVP